MISQPISPPNSGMLHAQLPNKLYQRILTELVDKREEKAEDYNSKLAGHLTEEFSVEDREIRHGIRDFVNILIREYYTVHGFSLPNPSEFQPFTPAMDLWFKTKNPRLDYDSLMSEGKDGFVRRWKQDSIWINYQKKTEFNPAHQHSGIFSIVIFVKLPFDSDDEDQFLPSFNTPCMSLKNFFSEEDFNNQRMLNLNGCFGINSATMTGEIQTCNLHVDKTFEGSMLLFPASLMHYVYPYYTSDEERITISSNFSLEKVHAKEFETTLKYE